ncbi:MAG: hypothetical protein ACYC8T_15710 [Myxococcaceae bacterium]
MLVAHALAVALLAAAPPAAPAPPGGSKPRLIVLALTPAGAGLNLATGRLYSAGDGLLLFRESGFVERITPLACLPPE